MNARRLLLLLTAVMAVATAFAQFSPRKDYVWARDILGATMTVDGVLNEAAWSSAESFPVQYGVLDGNPGSGWKVMNGSGTPLDPATGVLKFLADKNTNKLYIALVVTDSSVGGAGWENCDGVVAGIYERGARAESGVTLHRDIFITWIDSAGLGQLPNLHGGNLPGRSIVIAAATVQGISNSDTNVSGQREADQGWTLEAEVNLDSLGYNANSATVDAIQMSLCLWDADWLAGADHIATRAWWLNEWGNNGGSTAGRILVRNDVNINTTTLPAYEPDWSVGNGANYPDVVVDGNLTEDVWQYVPSFDIQFGNAALRNAYPTIGPDRSGQYVAKGPPGAIDRGRTKVKMFFKGDILYIGADVPDQALSSFLEDNFFDGLQLNMNIPTDSLRDPNVFAMAAKRFGFAVDSLLVGGSSRVWDAADSLGVQAITFGLHSRGTIDNSSDIDTGFTIELAIDLARLGYPVGQTNKMVALGLDYHDYDITPTDTSAYRVWWFREWPWASTPAFCLLDEANLITAVGEEVGLPAQEFRLRGNYPNPFNPSTTIQFSVPGAGTAFVRVYDLLGRQVDVQEIQVASARLQEATFHASQLASGVYFYRVEFRSHDAGATQISNTRKMVLMK
jgi:hypothetical protein